MQSSSSSSPSKRRKLDDSSSSSSSSSSDLTSATPQQIQTLKQTYEEAIRTGTIEVTKVERLHDGSTVTLHCREVDGVNVHPNLVKSGRHYQFQSTYARNIRFRMSAPKAALAFCYPQHSDDPNMTTSHLCHNSMCLNPYHVCFESLEVNKGRNGCSGPPDKCGHTPRCFIPGPNIASTDLSYIPIPVLTIFGAANALKK